MRPGSHSRPRQCGAIGAHCVSVKVVRIKVASHLAALNQPTISLEILKHQHALGIYLSVFSLSSQPHSGYKEHVQDTPIKVFSA